MSSAAPSTAPGPVRSTDRRGAAADQVVGRPGVGLGEPAAQHRHRRDAAHRQRREAQPGEEAVGVAGRRVDRDDDLLDAVRLGVRGGRGHQRPAGAAALVPAADDGVAHVHGRQVEQRVGGTDGQQRHAERLLGLVDDDDQVPLGVGDGVEVPRGQRLPGTGGATAAGVAGGRQQLVAQLVAEGHQGRHVGRLRGADAEGAAGHATPPGRRRPGA